MFHRKVRGAVTFAVAAMLAAVPMGRAQEAATAHVLVTAITRPEQAPRTVPRESVRVFQDGKRQDVSSWVPLRGDRAELELVILMDDSSRSTIGLHLGDLKKFIRDSPASTSIAIGYMRHGSPNLVQKLTTNHEAAAGALRQPVAQPGINGSPYLCLSDLIKHWPGQQSRARREVIMVTDGADPAWGRRYDPQDSYVLTAIRDAQRAGVAVYSIYYSGAGPASHGFSANIAGQNYLNQVSAATGGEAYFQGFSDPVSLQPFLNDIEWKLQNQYELGFVTTPSRQLRRISVNTTEPNVKLLAPQQIAARPNNSAGANLL